MRIKHMFKKTVRDIRGEEQENTPEVPDNLMRKCNACKAAVFVDEVKQNQYICPHCGNYFHVPAYRRIKLIADRKSFVEWDAHMEEQNPLQYRGYEEKLQGLREKTGLDEAVVTGKCTIKGTPVALGVCDCRFMMSSMGEVVGEKITRAFERATEEKLPVILYICSGGARMQEGLVSLMQMAKTSMAIRKHSDAGLLYVPVLTDPTTGGVTASFAMLGDIILAEPKALIGFAGPRVIEQTIGQKLPKGFQRAEFLLEHGFVDKIVKREEQRIVLADILRLHQDKILNNVQSDNTDIKNGFKSDNQELMKTVEEDNRIFVKGRVSEEDDKASKLICEKILPFGQKKKELWIQFPDKETYLEEEAITYGYLADSEGNDEVMIYCEKEKIVKKLPANKNISINPQILSRLMNHFGENRVKVVEKAIENHF